MDILMTFLHPVFMEKNAVTVQKTGVSLFGVYCLNFPCLKTLVIKLNERTSI